MNIINDADYYGLTTKQIQDIEAKYNARYICETSLKGDDGEYSYLPYLIFYSDVAHPQGSNYFGIRFTGENVYIINAERVLLDTFTGVVADNGDVIFSSCHHHYRTSPDGSVFIDGGRDYCRRPEDAKCVKVRVVGDHLEIVKS